MLGFAIPLYSSFCWDLQYLSTAVSARIYNTYLQQFLLGFAIHVYSVGILR